MAGDIILHLCRYHKWRSYNVWFLRYWAQQAGFFVILGYFLPFYSPNNPENKNLEKMKKAPEDVIILHMSTINENHICMIPEMWSTTDRFSSHFGSFYTPHPLTTQRIKILKKWKKKTPRDIIIVHKCTINDNNIIYGSWDMKYNRQFFFVISGHLGGINLKNENIKEMNWRYHILHKCTKNHDHRLYCSWDMAHDGCNCYFSFWAVLFSFTHLTAQKMKVSKKWKKHLRYHHLTQVHHKSWSYAFLRYGMWQM